jgi:hypothetical protein
VSGSQSDFSHAAADAFGKVDAENPRDTDLTESYDNLRREWGNISPEKRFSTLAGLASEIHTNKGGQHIPRHAETVEFLENPDIASLFGKKIELFTLRQWSRGEDFPSAVKQKELLLHLEMLVLQIVYRLKSAYLAEVKTATRQLPAEQPNPQLG